MLRTVRSVLHSISGSIFWFSSSHLPPAHASRALVEKGLLHFYRWELGRDPGLADAYSKIGSLLANQGQPGPAVACYARALAAGHPDAAKVHYFMGRQKARLGDVAGAVGCFRQFVRIAAEAKGVRADQADAWSRLDDLPDFDPGQFHGYLYLANRCIEGGLEAAAIEFLNASITLEPLVFRAHAALAEILHAAGRRKEALEVVRSGHYFQLRQSHPHLRVRGLRRKGATRPDFLILGKLKCGTTSLYTWLTRHPCIVPALTKELHFFDDRYDRGLDWYLAQFPPIGNRPDLITGEASADYIDSQLAAERIRRDFPRTRFIVLLRDPVERAISHYRMNVRLGLEAGDMETALFGGIDPVSGSAPPNEYVDRSIYVKMLKVWLTLFPREQFLILSSEQLFAAPGAVTNRVIEFLGQAPFAGDDYRARNQGPQATVDPALKARLREHFRPHNQALERFLDMRFGWDD